MIARSLALGEKKKQDLSWNVRNFLALVLARKAYNGHPKFEVHQIPTQRQQCVQLQRYAT
jgi:hypothetical protein